MQYLFATLTTVTFFPLLGVLVLLFIRPEQKNTLRWVALITSLITFGLSLIMLAQFNAGDPGLQLVVRAPWIQIGSDWRIEFHMAVDGLSVLLILLTTFLTPLSIASTWEAIQERVKEFMIFFLLLEVRFFVGRPAIADALLGRAWRVRLDLTILAILPLVVRFGPEIDLILIAVIAKE